MTTTRPNQAASNPAIALWLQAWPLVGRVADSVVINASLALTEYGHKSNFESMTP